MLLRNSAIKRYFIFSPHLTSVPELSGEMQKHKNVFFFTQMLYYCVARLQQVASLICSVLLLITHARAGV